MTSSIKSDKNSRDRFVLIRNLENDFLFLIPPNIDVPAGYTAYTRTNKNIYNSDGNLRKSFRVLLTWAPEAEAMLIAQKASLAFATSQLNKFDSSHYCLVYNQEHSVYNRYLRGKAIPPGWIIADKYFGKPTIFEGKLLAKLMDLPTHPSLNLDPQADEYHQSMSLLKYTGRGSSSEKLRVHSNKITSPTKFAELRA